MLNAKPIVVGLSVHCQPGLAWLASQHWLHYQAPAMQEPDDAAHDVIMPKLADDAYDVHRNTCAELRCQ